MPGAIKPIRRHTHPQYIASTPSVTCYIPCLVDFVREETPVQWRNFLPTLFTYSFSPLPPPSHLVFSPLPTLSLFTFHFSLISPAPGPIISHSLCFYFFNSSHSDHFLSYQIPDISWCWVSHLSFLKSIRLICSLHCLYAFFPKRLYCNCSFYWCNLKAYI